MSIGLESDVKQIVVSTSAFGPQEIEQITGAIANNYGRYRDLRDAVGRARSPAEPQPGDDGPARRLLLPARPLQRRDRNARRTATAAR